MIFNDLCAKDNGLNLKTFGFYTFQKVFNIVKLLFSIRGPCRGS